MTLVVTAEIPGWSSGVSSSSRGKVSDGAAPSLSTKNRYTNEAVTTNMSSGLMAIRIVIAHDCSHCVNQHSSSDCLTRAAIPQAKWLYCPQCTWKPRWRTCAWVCLFFGPYPELLYLPRPSLCRLSSSSSSLSDQTSFWLFCRQTWRISTVITAHSRKYSCTKWSNSCQISWCLG